MIADHSDDNEDNDDVEGLAVAPAAADAGCFLRTFRCSANNIQQ